MAPFRKLDFLLVLVLLLLLQPDQILDELTSTKGGLMHYMAAPALCHSKYTHLIFFSTFSSHSKIKMMRNTSMSHTGSF